MIYVAPRSMTTASTVITLFSLTVTTAVGYSGILSSRRRKKVQKSEQKKRNNKYRGKFFKISIKSSRDGTLFNLFLLYKMSCHASSLSALVATRAVKLPTVTRSRKSAGRRAAHAQPVRAILDPNDVMQVALGKAELLVEHISLTPRVERARVSTS